MRACTVRVMYANMLQQSIAVITAKHDEINACLHDFGLRAHRHQSLAQQALNGPHARNALLLQAHELLECKASNYTLMVRARGLKHIRGSDRKDYHIRGSHRKDYATPWQCISRMWSSNCWTPCGSPASSGSSSGGVVGASSFTPMRRS